CTLWHSHNLSHTGFHRYYRAHPGAWHRWHDRNIQRRLSHTLSASALPQLRPHQYDLGDQKGWNARRRHFWNVSLARREKPIIRLDCREQAVATDYDRARSTRAV